MGITTVDPIKHGLLFERFIDINRNDLPDIDIDFPDHKRMEVIEDLFNTHGAENVCHIANVNLYQERSAIGDVGTALRIPKFEVEALKDSVIERGLGEARADLSIKDTFDTTTIGQEFAEKYPAIRLAEKLQGHATHMGKHAAGVIVSNEDVTKYGGIDTRQGSIMMDKHGAEYLDLLKIDCLGLRTLSVLEDCLHQIGKSFDDLYNLPLDNKQAFQIFNKMRLNGIFQFEGQSMHSACKQMGVESFDDIVAITALVRPGPLSSGGCQKFIDRRTGRKPVEYLINHPAYIKHTEDTYGVIVYQEQLMYICRDCGNMSWEDVSAIRKAASKTLGKEYMSKYETAFLNGCSENGIDTDSAKEAWENMLEFGSWSMNKSHSVAYGYISYWGAYLKAHHPLEFTAANLRHTKDDASAVKILRDAVENDGLEYIPVDPDNSDVEWSVKNGILMGGLINIKGIAEKTARKIVEWRDHGKGKITKSDLAHLMEPKTSFDTIYPCRDLWGSMYTSPREHGLTFAPSYIKEIYSAGEYIFIGKVIYKEVRDLNEYNEVVKRGGKILQENDKSLKLIIEDDTGQISCSINRFKFTKNGGQKIADSIIEGETWVAVKGEVSEGWRFVHIDQIVNLEDLKND